MENFIDRVRNALRRTGERMASQRVPVRSGSRAPEDFGSRPQSAPKTDVFENDAELMLRADTPGAFPDNTWLYWDERSTLSLYVRRPDDGHDGHVGDWYRAFVLPRHADGGRARATLKDGVLTVHVPKREPAKPITVSVRNV